MKISKFHIFILFLIAACSSRAAPINKLSKGACSESGAKVIFADGTSKDFPAKKGYKCSDFKMDAEHRYAAWKLSGDLVVEVGASKQIHADAILFTLIDGKTFPVTENTRFIRNWYFVKNHHEIIVESTFEHGPSNFILYDLEERKRIETCGQFELIRCSKLKMRMLEKH